MIAEWRLSVCPRRNSLLGVIKPPNRSGRPILEIRARQRNSTVLLNEDFGADPEEIIM